MTTAQVVEMSVTVNNSPIQDYVHPDNHTQPTYFVGKHPIFFCQYFDCNKYKILNEIVRFSNENLESPQNMKKSPIYKIRLMQN